MKKLAYIFCIALFLFGCGGAASIDQAGVLDISYDPLDYPPQIFSPKDRRPTLYIDSVKDNRKFAAKEHISTDSLPVIHFLPSIDQSSYTRTGRFEEDSTLIYESYHWSFHYFMKTPKAPPEIIREALETEVYRFGIKLTKDRNLADGVLKTSIEEFRMDKSKNTQYFPFRDKEVLVKINLKLYATDFDDPVWSGALKGLPEKRALKGALNTAIKQWYSYPGFKEAVVSLAGNVSSPPSPQQAQITQKQVATLKAGTGVMLGEAEYVLTSYHLVRGMKQIRVKFVNGEEIDAPLFIKDEVNDIAFLKLNQSPNISLMNIAVGDSSQMQIGNKVFTIGYPISNILGQKPKYSEGVINSLSGIKDNLGFFQVSVPIQSGNSGGPLFNQHGELVAIVSSSLDPENTFRVLGTMPQNVNFAVKSSLVKNMIPMLPETLAAPTGIVVVPTDTDSLQSFIKGVQNNIVLIEAKE
tara:strand:+ start:43 stop:1446 length:1404 start_codon:yes stop_codon:yes gene_type:complete